ncbi:NlpC/P60 family protein [Pseudomonas siliginis]|uniref:NlpC/P60 family protein n=1 Tax=Pseudomonas siliginis TaxID=2842346 RepID=UPI00338E852C
MQLIRSLPVQTFDRYPSARTARPLKTVGGALNRQSPKSGDLLFFNFSGGARLQHVGLYLGW